MCTCINILFYLFSSHEMSLLSSDCLYLIMIPNLKKLDFFFQALKVASSDRLKVHLGDAKYFEYLNVFPPAYARPWQRSTPNIHIVGNLPFNVSLGLLLQWLEQIANRSGPWEYGRVPLTLTFQEEVAKRILAKVDSNDRCKLSIMCQYLCKIRYKYHIPGKEYIH